jgi:hypothetical protein
MDILLEQRINFSKIVAYKNYSTLDEKPELYSHFTYNGYTSDSVTPTDRHCEAYMDFREHLPKKNTRHFYDEPENAKEYQRNRIVLKNILPHSYIIHTKDQKKINRHLYNPFSYFATKIYTRTVYRKGDKLIIKFNSFMKNRQIFHRFFKKTVRNCGISLNLKNGDITFFNDKIIRKNNFLNFKSLIDNTLLNVSSNTLKLYMGMDNINHFSQSIFDEFQKEFDNDKFIDAIFNELNKIDGFNVSEYSLKNRNPTTLYVTLIEVLLHLKKIKTPNNYINLLEHWYPTVKYLRKNDNKLVQSILDRLNIKSKKLNKIFHENENLCVEVFPILSWFFGKDDLSKYISNIDKRYFTLSFGYSEYRSYCAFKTPFNVYELTSKEKTNLLKLLNNIIDDIVNENIIFPNFISEIKDHFRMLSTLKEFYPNLQLNATTRETFNSEHRLLSRLHNEIVRGYTTEFIFEDGMVEYLEKPIIHNDIPFYPKLLRIDHEYVEEGNHMHHCVGSYSSKKTSIIISLRQNEINSHERITNEYSVERKDVIQSKYFCNASPPEIFVKPLMELSKRVRNYPGSLEYIEFKEIPLIINGIDVKDKQAVNEFEIF